MSGVALAARLVLAAIFLIAGLAKLADRQGSRTALEGFGVRARLARPVGIALPVAELVTAVALVVPATAWSGAVAAAALVGLFIAGIAVSLARGVEPDCHCFGQLHSEPVGWRTLARNLALLALAVVVIAEGAPGPMMSPVSWVTELSTTETVLAAVVLFLAFVAVGQGWFMFELLRQNGRILARLDDIQNGATAADSAPAVTNGNGRQPGLPVGMPAPDFTLDTLAEVPVSLKDLRSRLRPVVLVFSDPACGPCNALLPELAAWQAEHEKRLTLALISRGTPEQNRAKASEHALANVLIQKDREVAQCYQAHGTPAAQLVTSEGRLASPLALGPQAVRDLIANAAGSAIEVLPSTYGSRTSHPPRPSAGLPVGTTAPDLSWQDLDGHPISISELRGTPATLIFWNPDCGFCQRMTNDLRTWRESAAGTLHNVLLISGGTPAQNRELHRAIPTVLDDGLQGGRAFGVDGTPSAVALDPDGNVAADVAVGAPAIFALLDAQCSLV